MKQCTQCKQTKKYNEYYKRASSSDGYKTECIECSKKRTNKWRQKNKNKIKQYWSKWVKDNKEHRQQYQKQYMRLHQQNNKAYWNARNSQRRAQKLKATPAWLNTDYAWMIEEIYELCQLRSKVTGVDHHVDHIVPLKGKTVCGLHVPWNLQVIPWYDNLTKRNNLISGQSALLLQTGENNV